MIYTYTLNGLPLQTGDIICTTDGGRGNLITYALRAIGSVTPGPVKHVLVYVGPGGWCVESGPKGVIAFRIEGDTWVPERMRKRRGELMGRLYGVAYPLAGQRISRRAESRIRAYIARYCLEQAEAGKPYNLNLLNPDTERAFYCSQLAYRAYLPVGIDLNSELGIPSLPGLRSIVFPQEVWSGCAHLIATAGPAGVDPLAHARQR